MIRQFMRHLRADFQKCRRIPFLWIHILVPILILGLFWLMESFGHWSFNNKISQYVETICVGLPFIIGILTAMSADQEESAGQFQNMLTSRKVMCFFSKLSMLVLLEALSLMSAIGGYVLGEKCLFGERVFSPTVFGKLFMIIWASSVFLYIFHLMVSLRFEKGWSIGLGLVESMIAALMLTGLGDFIWIWIPASWPSRLSETYLKLGFDRVSIPMIAQQLHNGIWTFVIGTICLLAVSFLWFSFFEGKSEN